ncbi:hypothetical protein LINPERPRIM_LOCUS28227 [Linum perenne]
MLVLRFSCLRTTLFCIG